MTLTEKEEKRIANKSNVLRESFIDDIICHEKVTTKDADVCAKICEEWSGWDNCPCSNDWNYKHACREIYDELIKAGGMKAVILLPESKREYYNAVRSYGSRIFQTFCLYLKVSGVKEIMLIKNKDNLCKLKTYFLSEESLCDALHINDKNMLKTFGICKFRLIFTNDKRIGIVGLHTLQARLKNPLKPIGVWYLDTKEPICDLLEHSSPDYFQVWQKLKNILIVGNKVTLEIDTP